MVKMDWIWAWFVSTSDKDFFLALVAIALVTYIITASVLSYRG